MFKFSNWFVSVASFLVFFVVGEGQSTEKSKDDGVSALQPSVITLTEAEKQAIVFGHNDYRSVQRASNMQKMKWNEYLADMASEWVSRCIFEHGQPPRDQKELPFTYIGQNLFASKRKIIPYFLVDHWVEEWIYYDFPSNSCEKDRVCGDYTQTVWSSSTDVGCGIAQCTNSSSGESWYNAACNYGPGGNYVGEWPYERGPDCSKCEVGQHCDDGGLCTTI